MQRGDKYWQCPFCGKETVKVFHKPAHNEYKVSRGSGQRGGQYVRVPEKIEVISDCENCGASKNKIQRVIDGKETINSSENKNVCMRCGKELEDSKSRLCKECDAWYQNAMKRT